MIERIVENWLTKSSERSYQLPFCYLLAQNGKTVIHLTRHCSMEHGKDIIALDNVGRPHAYQLKGVHGARLKMREWQEIQNQIYQLIYTPCSHPSIKSSEYHKSYLVLNGDIDEDVQHAITIFNNDWEKRGQPQYRLEVIVKGEILSMALEVKDQFIPTELYDFKSLLEFYLEDGVAFLDKGKLSNLLLHVVDKYEKGEDEFKRLVSSTALLCSLATTNYSNANNHLAIVEAWCVYISIVLRAIEENNKPYKLCRNEIAIAQEIIKIALLNLYEEITDKPDFLQSDSLSDAFVFKHRTTILLGMMSYVGTYKDLSFSDIDSLIQKHIKYTNLWGESSIPFFLSIYLFYVKHNQHEKAIIFLEATVRRVMDAIVNPKVHFTDIYTSAEESIIPQFTNEDMPSYTPRISYILEPLLILLTNAGCRNLVEEIWVEITRCIFNNFSFDNKADYFLWKANEGEEATRHPELTKSWKELLVEKSEFDINQIPKGLQEYPSLIPLFWMVYPHRLSSNVLKWYIATTT